MSNTSLESYQTQVADAMRSAAKQYMKDNPPDKVAKETINFLEDNRKDILLTLLGFEVDGWGKGQFKVDHCNGRSGESAVGDYLRQVQCKEINAWLASADLGSIPPDVEATMRRTYQDEFERRTRQLVQQKATQDAEQAFEKLKLENSLDKLVQMDSLLDN